MKRKFLKSLFLFFINMKILTATLAVIFLKNVWNNAVFQVPKLKLV